MTIEERFERITAGLAEERHKDREEYKTLWRDTQRQLDELARATLENARAISELGVRLRETTGELGICIRDLAEESREADRRLGERIDSLVSPFGEFLRQGRRE